jgi:hypothetical protein
MSELTTLRVIGQDGEYYVKASFIKSLPFTAPGESVAWNGTGEVYKDSKGNYYINYHSGSSSTYAFAYQISESWAQRFLDAADDKAEFDKVRDAFGLI